MFFAKSCAYKYAQVFSLCMHVLVSTYTQINIWHFVICTAIGFDVFTILVKTDGEWSKFVTHIYMDVLQKYEEEIMQMEKMRGVDVKFVNPEV